MKFKSSFLFIIWFGIYNLFSFSAVNYVSNIVVSTFLGSGTTGEVDGTGISVQLNSPDGLCIDSTNLNYLYVVDHVGLKIHKVEIDTAISTQVGTSK